MQIDADGELLNVTPERSSVTISSSGHDILVKHAVTPTDWLPLGMCVDTAKAWLFYITKHNVTREQLTISFKLLHKGLTTRSSANTGQWLTAIEFENDIRQVHIGTQDEEWFARYAEQNWMPKRLIAALDKEGLVITTVEDDGLETKLPELLVGEQFYLHYILADSPRRKSTEYPDDWDVST
ncbi:MAG: hypothetical protein EOO60_13450, partial [Hymenobacter sp.]